MKKRPLAGIWMLQQGQEKNAAALALPLDACIPREDWQRWCSSGQRGSKAAPRRATSKTASPSYPARILREGQEDTSEPSSPLAFLLLLLLGHNVES